MNATSQSASVTTATLIGVETCEVEVEVDLGPGMVMFSTVGLPAGAVVEAKTRVKSALQNAGFSFPQRRIIVNLAPAHIRKQGSAFDLPIALGILVANGVLPAEALDGAVIFGELALDGRLRHTRGALPMALHARTSGARRVIAPMECAEEIRVVGGIEHVVAEHLAELVEILLGERAPLPLPAPAVTTKPGTLDLADVRGQAPARRALEIAAAGGHNMLLIGPPGVGKTLLARRYASIAPPMTEAERLQAAAIASVAGHQSPAVALAGTRAFRAPHHGVSATALIGGGNPPRPGEVTLAHNGVLFLDELPEFNRSALEALRQPLEDREVLVSRVNGQVKWPARFALLASMNPCPCGYLGHPTRPCTDPPHRVEAYRSRVSGPLLDRIDLQVAMSPIPPDTLLSADPGEASSVVAERVTLAVARQRERAAASQRPLWVRNGDLTASALRGACVLTSDAARFIRHALERLGFSARAHDRILRVARTIADLDASPDIDTPHIAEAIQYRQLDRGRVEIGP